jgi:hypothetical protein
MRVWYDSNYFDLKLPVQCLPADQNPDGHTKFTELGIWFMHGNKAFLQHLPDLKTTTGQQQVDGKSVSAAVLASDRNALSPVDESNPYAASVHQLVADDDDNIASDVTILERYDSNQPSSTGAAQQQQAGGLNPTAQPWNQRGGAGGLQAGNANWQQQQQQQQGLRGSTGGAQGQAQQAWAPGAVGGVQQSGGTPPLHSQTSPSNGLQANSLSLLQQQQNQQRLAIGLQSLPALHAQYNSLQPLNIQTFLQAFNLTQAQVATLTQPQLQGLHSQFLSTNQQRYQQQQAVQRQIQQILLLQQQIQQQQQQQANPLAFQQQQQQQQQYQQNQYLQGGQQQAGFGAAAGQGQFGQQQQQPSQFGQQYGQQQQQRYGQLDASRQQQNWNNQGAYGIAGSMGALSLNQQQNSQFSQQASYQQQAQQQSTADMNQTIVYTPNQVTAPEFTPSTQPQQPAPTPQTTVAPAEPAYEEPAPAEDAQESEQPTEEPQAEQEQQQEDQEESHAHENGDEEERQQEEETAEATSTQAPQQPAQPAAPSVAPWAAKKAVVEPTKVKSLMEIQAEEERAQKQKNLTAKEQAAQAARRMPFNTTWGGQATGLSLTPDEHSTATVIHANQNNALLPTPSSTVTPSIKLLTPILSTGKQPHQHGRMQTGKNGRRTEPAIVQMDQPAESVVSPAAATAAAPTAAATTPAAKPAAAPAPVVNAWAKRAPAAAAAASSPSSALLPSPTHSTTSPQQSVTMLNPPLLTIRPKSMQSLEGAAPMTKPLNTVRILETTTLEMPVEKQRKSSTSRPTNRATGSSTVRKTAASSSTTAAASEDKETTAFGGPTMSADFERWCASHLTKLAGADGYDVSLPQFLMTVQSDEEARGYMHEYLGTSAAVDEFADEFLQLRAFETAPQQATSKDAASAGDSETQVRRTKRRGNQEF